MREARAADHWRHATERDRGFGLVRASFSTTAPLHEVELDFAKGITVLCGLNGVGKSTVLRLIEASLNGIDSLAGRCRTELLQTGGMTLTLNLDGEEITRTLGEGPIGRGGRVEVIDAFVACSKIITVSADPNFSDLVEGVEGDDWTPERIELANYVVGRSYSAVRVLELENPTPLEEGFGEAVVPFFAVESRGVKYDSFAMGSGELAGLIALWQILHVEPNTIVVVEEPESFLSSRSTIALLDVLAMQIHQRRLYALVTTHSLDVVARAPIEHVRLLVPRLDSPHIDVVTPASRASLERLLGTFIGRGRLVVTEDQFASFVVSELLIRFAGLWGEGIEVQPAGDASKVLSLCSTFPRTRDLSVVGVLDGDQALPDPQPAWPLLRLPGPGAPDTIMRLAAIAHQSDFVALLGREATAVAAALNGADGLNAHDWFTRVGEILSLEETAVARAAVGCWLMDKDATASAAAFASELSDKLG